jgi:hypothetical protein
MSQTNRSRNRALVDFVVLPSLFLTVALLGGLRISAESRTFIFIAPPLITLLLATLSMLLFVRGDLLRFHQWVGSDLSPLTNVAHIWMFITIFFGSAQAFNSVLPERGLFHWLFSFFFLWTLWNNQFSSFDTPGSCAALRFCSVLLSSSSISFWRVFIVPRVVGSTAWQVRYCKGSPSARIDEYRRLPAAERQAVREAILRDPGESSE